MSGGTYRPRPDNGSGDSPRPPFLTEFVNHIREVFFVHAIYHLIGGTLSMRVHPHIERSFRLKTKTSCGVFQLHAACAQIGEQPVQTCGRYSLAYFGKACVQQRDPWPLILKIWRWST